VLRLLATERPRPHGGAVTYLAECADVPDDLIPACPDLAPHPLRAAWAHPGGPAASVRWAVDALTGLGRHPVTADQQRSWNLSAIWRLHGPWGTAWLKQIPPFFAHEAAVLRWLGAVTPDRVPVLLAAADGRLLMAHAPGEDCYDAGPAEVAGQLDDLHTLQLAALGHVDTLVALGVPDRRGPNLAAPLLDVARRYGADVPDLDHLVAGLPERLAAVAACGLPDTLVHGDFHAGNARSDGTVRTLIDWGDSFVGHPAFDVITLTAGAPDDPLIARWAAAWRRAVPGCAPEEAARLLRPVAQLRDAAVYAAFVDAIEPSEQPYHRADIADGLRRAVAAAT
jgi:hypothetical protein